MASFGEQLRQAREAKQITLPEISAATKISVRALQAMEEEQFDRLPGGIFNKGFVRAYARYVGLDEEKMLAQYQAAAKLELPETEKPSPPQTAAARNGGVNGVRAISLLAVAVALVLGWLWWKEHRREQREMTVAAPQPAAAASSPEAPMPLPPSAPGTDSPATVTSSTATSASQTNAADAATQAAVPSSPQATLSPAQSPAKEAAPESSHPSAPVEVTITATAPSWIGVQRDGGAQESLTLDPEKPELRSRSFQARKELRLVAGNPEGVTVTYNGKPAGPLGEANHPVRIRFTASGMEVEKPAKRAAAVQGAAENSGAEEQTPQAQ